MMTMVTFQMLEALVFRIQTENLRREKRFLTAECRIGAEKPQKEVSREETHG